MDGRADRQRKAVHRARFRGPDDDGLDDETLVAQVESSARTEGEPRDAAGFRAFEAERLSWR
jgi:hypothetical protein